MQGLSLPTCLLTIPCWVYCSTMKSQTASIHTHMCVHTTHTYIDRKCPKDNVTHLIAATVFALSCACVWRTGSPCAQTHTIGSLSHHIIVYVCAVVCVCACFVSVCLSLTAGTCLTSWYWQLLSVRDSRDGGEWDSEREGQVDTVSTISLPAKLSWNVLYYYTYFHWLLGKLKKT